MKIIIKLKNIFLYPVFFLAILLRKVDNKLTFKGYLDIRMSIEEKSQERAACPWPANDKEKWCLFLYSHDISMDAMLRKKTVKFCHYK